MKKVFLYILKNYFSKYLPNNIKIVLSKMGVIILFKIRKFFHFYKLDKLLISMCFKINEFEKIKEIISNHKQDVNYCRILEKVSRYEVLGDTIYDTRFDKDRMLCFDPDKYNKLINLNKQLLQEFPSDYILHNQMARNYVAAGYLKRAKFHFKESLKLQREAKRAEQKTGIIFLASMNRSGTNYVSSALRNGLGLNTLSHQIPSIDSWYPNYTIINTPVYVNHHSFSPMPDGIFAIHMMALKSNLWILSMITDKLIVNLRDPRQQLISFYHHLEFLRRRGDISALIQCQIPDGYFLWSMEKKLNWQIENYCVPTNIQWIKSWLEADKDPDFLCEILICQHQTLAKEPKKYFQKILSFYGIPESKFIFPLLPKFAERTAMRKGSTDEWSKTLTSEQIQKINNSIPEDWFQKFGWNKT